MFGSDQVALLCQILWGYCSIEDGSEIPHCSLQPCGVGLGTEPALGGAVISAGPQLMWSSAWCGCHRGQRSSGCMNRNTVQKEGGVALSFSGCQATLSWWLLAQVPQFRGNKLRTFKEWLGGRWSQASEEQKQGTLEIIRWSVFAHAPMFVCVAGEVNMKYVCQKVCTFHLDPVSS